MQEHQEYESTEIIAEAGVNHNGDIDIARKLINKGSNAGADAVKFQTFNPDELVTENTKKADYQERSTSDNQYDMLSSLTLSKDEYLEISEHCEKKGIEFISTPYDSGSVELLENLNVSRYKIGSADIINKPLLKSVVDTGKPIILSTGMANLCEIERAVEFLRDNGCDNLTLLHCVSSYPADPNQVNMRFMNTLKTAFDAQVGFSDHTLGIHIPMMAASHGATIIEKHFTLDKRMDGPDHYASLEPNELEAMINNIRDVKKAMGSSVRSMSEDEKRNRHPMRRSLHVKNELSRGKTITEDDLMIVRPYDGIDPWSIDEVLGRRISNNLQPNEPLKWEDIE